MDDALLEVEVSGYKLNGDDPKTVGANANSRARAPRTRASSRGGARTVCLCNL
jgi:hypothetical protein